MKKEEKKPLQRIASVSGLVLCACLIPVLVINLLIILESRLHPEEVPGVLGLTPMVVVTGSMDPGIAAGDMILTVKVPAEQLKVGDIIAFFDPSLSGRTVTTHRIMSIDTAEDGSLLFTTKGDANTDSDSLPVPEENIVGVYRLKIPKLGRLTLYMKSGPGILLFAVLPAAIFLGFEFGILLREKKRKEAENMRLRQELSELRREPERIRI